ncbi:MAG: lytic transglycosylase domain-containing protein, partial [Bacillota bacterium]|nr:lytic transglycosylase domain-containing protein [Bacillota bacterium]
MRKFLKVLLTILLAAFVILYALNSVKVKYRDEMNSSADKYGLDKHMVYAVVKAESNFDNDAVSYKGAMGLMQITGETAKWCAGKMGDSTLAENLFDPETNIDMGCFYLSYLLDRFDGDVNSAVAAY